MTACSQVQWFGSTGSPTIKWQNMSLKSLENSLEYSEFYSFSAGGILRAPNRLSGVYTIYANLNCLYVGKTEHQSLQKRLFDHYRNCHNLYLKRWILSDRQLRFRFIIVKDASLIDSLEKALIQKLSPSCNVRK